eukprot:m.75652 g.75652  ORF g.75652 m.75652 type:complete len:85 (-) comp20531_c0_seq7:69-323(-)
MVVVKIVILPPHASTLTSDIHTGRNEWGFVIHPLVPGHEMVGKVTEVGKEVTKYKVGDIVGVGCFVDSCRSCTACKQGEVCVIG